MGNFRNGNRGFGGRSGGGFNRGSSGRRGFGDREFRDRDEGFGRKREMHNVICDKCKKECQVPFKPTGDKPVFCSDCFSKNESGFGGGSGFGLDKNKSTNQGMSNEQFNQINKKLDAILEILNNIEIDVVEEDSEEDSDDDDLEED